MYIHTATSALLFFLSTLHTTVASPQSIATAPRQYQARDALAYLEGEANMLYRRDEDSDKKICDLSKAAMGDGVYTRPTFFKTKSNAFTNKEFIIQPQHLSPPHQTAFPSHR